MTSVIIFYNHWSKQYYIRLKPGIIEDDEKAELLDSFRAVNGGAYEYGAEPNNANIMYFQEFEEPDTKNVYYNINGDRPVYDLIEKWGRHPEYYI